MDIFSYLSTPFEGDFAALTAELAATQYRAFCVRAQRFAEKAGHGKDALVVDITKRLGQREATTAYWTPEVGAIFTGLKKQTLTDLDWQWLRAQIALSAHLTGLISELQLEVETNAPLLVCGRKIPPARLVIQGGPSRLTIQAEGAPSARSFSVFGRRNGAPVWAADDAPPVFLHLDGEPAIRFVGDDWHSIWAEQTCQPAAVDQTVVDQFNECLRLVEQSMPEYRAWVLCLLKEITPIRRPAKNTLASNSSAIRPGGIDIAVPASPTETAEMLIHECSHQYFHMASWVGSMVTPDARPYYSPLKNCERPLDRILLGYHAFGNALIAFERFCKMGLEQEIAERVRTVAGYMEQLRVPVEKEDGLSELGLALYRPLRTRLAQTRYA